MGEDICFGEDTGQSGDNTISDGIGAYFAIDNAIKSFNPNFNSTVDAPFTNEKVLMGLYATSEPE